ncbi:MAG: hypothetical protein GY866_18225 [Proteobacteria bacterium]|nr:hypothetical protein [Pseudomonadota bacterium]
MFFRSLSIRFLPLGIVFPVLVSLLAMSLAGGCDRNSKKRVTIIPEEETIAVVNNKKISLATFNARLHLFLKRYRQFVVTDDKPLGTIKEIVINQLVEEELIGQEASRKGIQVSEEELEAITAEYPLVYEDANIDKLLTGNNLNEAEWRKRFRKHLIRKKIVQKQVISKIPITKREIRSYYREHRRKLVRPQAFKIRNITLSTEGEAKAIRSKILRGKNFKYLVREHSISRDKAFDGDLGYIERGDLPREMETAIFRLGYSKHKSQISGVVTSQDGYHIFKLEKYRRRKSLSLNEAKSMIKKILIRQRWDDSYRKWMAKLRENAKISIDQTMLTREEGF